MNVIDFFHQGVAFLPHNEEGLGDVLVTYGNRGEREIEKVTVRGYLQQLTRFLGKDLITLRQCYGQAIAKKQMVPLPLAPHWTLIPVYVRKPIGKQQAHGWIVKQAIERIEGERSMVLHLRGNHQILVYHTYADLRRILREAQLVELHYQLLHQTPDWVKESKEYYLYKI